MAASGRRGEAVGRGGGSAQCGGAGTRGSRRREGAHQVLEAAAVLLALPVQAPEDQLREGDGERESGRRDGAGGQTPPRAAEGSRPRSAPPARPHHGPGRTAPRGPAVPGGAGPGRAAPSLTWCSSSSSTSTWGHTQHAHKGRESGARSAAPCPPQSQPARRRPAPSLLLPFPAPLPVPSLPLPPGPAGSPAHLGGFLAGSGLQEPGDQVIELCVGTGRGTGEGDTVTKRADSGGAPAASATHRLPAGSGRPLSPSSSGGPRGRGGGGSRPADSALLQRPSAHGRAPLPVRGVRPAAVLRRLHGIAVRPIDSPARRRQPPSWVQGAPPAARGRCGAAAGSGEAAGRKGRAVTRGGGPGRGEGALRPVGPGSLRAGDPCVCVWKARENRAASAPPRGRGRS